MRGQSIHLLGGGVIGLCTAWHLRRLGWQVTIVDRSDLDNGTSFGNAGMIVPSHFVPMAAPGVIRKGLKWMLDRKSPFYIKPRLDKELVGWLWRFYRASKSRQMQAAMKALMEFNERSKALYSQLSEEAGFDFDYEEKGLLMLFQDEKQEKEEAEMAKQAAALGMEAHLMNQQELQTLEPELDLNAKGGLYFPGDAHLSPHKFMAQMRRRLEEMGVTFLLNKEIRSLQLANGRVRALVDAAERPIPVEQIALTAGSWTGKLLKTVGVNLPLQDGKGYSMTFPQLPHKPRIPTILSEAKVAVTPMGADLRVSGTLELSGWSPQINRERVKGILDSMERFYPDLELPEAETVEVWKGYRPCSPDGLPYVGKIRGIGNLLVGTGHGMMGLSLGAGTGKMLAEIAEGRPPSMDATLFDPNRYRK